MIYIAARQNNEIDVLREYNIENLFLEFTKNRKWKIDGDYTHFDMIWKYTSGNWDKFVDGVIYWKGFLSAIILPIGKTIEVKDMDVFYEAKTKKEVYELMDRGITNIYMSIELYRLESKYILERARKMEIDMKFIVRGDKSEADPKYIYAFVSYLPLDYAISKRVMVYRYGKREIRPVKEFALVDFNVTFNGNTLGIDYDKMKKGDYLEIFKFNALAYWVYDIKKQRYVPKWLDEYERLKERGELPDWVNDYDKKGRPKARYLMSRYNRIKHGIYSRVLVNENIICDTCPIRDKCPFYKPGAVCAYTDIWKDLGNTRNVSWIIKKLGDIIAEEYARYMRAVYIEGMSGDVANKAITQLSDSLAKKLELYNRLLKGESDTKISGSVDLNINMSIDEALESVRAAYGEELAKKIEERLKNEEE